MFRTEGIKKFIDSILSHYLNRIYSRYLKSISINYDFLTAIFYARSLDKWTRYKYIIRILKEKMRKNYSILEVGSGIKGIFEYKQILNLNLKLYLLDVNRSSLTKLNAYSIVGDGCNLPFKNKTFDIVISLDVIEHIPKNLRLHYSKEMQRVCKKKLFITCPLESKTRLFQGRKYDISFQKLHTKHFRFEEPKTNQHIIAGHPTLKEIKKLFPNSKIKGYKNCNIWLQYMILSRKPILGLFIGLLFLLFWEKRFEKPPFWGAIIILDLSARA